MIELWRTRFGARRLLSTPPQPPQHDPRACHGKCDNNVAVDGEIRSVVILQNDWLTFQPQSYPLDSNLTSKITYGRNSSLKLEQIQINTTFISSTFS